MSEASTSRTAEKELIFVYNARSDIFSKVTDFAHKIISPDSYSCSLCSLTHGSLGMHREWTEFIRNLPVKVSFLYKDQVTAHPKINFPQVWLRDDSNVKVILGAAELKSFSSLEALMVMIRRRLKEEG